jgi:hypothetical protein
MTAHNPITGIDALRNGFGLGKTRLTVNILLRQPPKEMDYRMSCHAEQMDVCQQSRRMFGLVWIRESKPIG